MASKYSRGIPLGAVCPKITRGIQLSKMDIVRCLSPLPTGYRYLSLADMDKTLSVELDVSSLPYFNPAPLGKSVEQYCIRKDMVLLSKNDTPYKVDYVGDIGDEKIIISGNIYMMTVDAQRISPVCLSFWLKSREGMMMLRNASSSTGENMKWISIRQLKEMLIPEFTVEDQYILLERKIKEMTASMNAIHEQLLNLKNTLSTLQYAMPDFTKI